MKKLPHFSYPSEIVERNKPQNVLLNEDFLFSNEYVKVFDYVSSLNLMNCIIAPNGLILDGILLNKNQYNIKPGRKSVGKDLIKTYTSLLNASKIKKLNTCIWVCNRYSGNFFHWFFDVLQKLEFIERNTNRSEDLLNYKGLMIIIPATHDKDYIKETLSAFNLNFYWDCPIFCV